MVSYETLERHLRLICWGHNWLRVLGSCTCTVPVGGTPLAPVTVPVSTTGVPATAGSGFAARFVKVTPGSVTGSVTCAAGLLCQWLLLASCGRCEHAWARVWLPQHLGAPAWVLLWGYP